MSVTEWRHSAISALIVVLVLSTAADAVWTPFPCSFLDSQGRYFDLSNMYRNHSSTSQADYQYYTGTTVFVNVCGQTAPGYCKPENGVCAVSGSSIGWGNAQYATWKPYSVAGSSAVGVTITYTRGFACSSTEHTSILNIACTSSGGDGQISSVSTSGCVHTIKYDLLRCLPDLRARAHLIDLRRDSPQYEQQVGVPDRATQTRTGCTAQCLGRALQQHSRQWLDAQHQLGLHAGPVLQSMAGRDVRLPLGLWHCRGPVRHSLTLARLHSASLIVGSNGCTY